MILTEAFLPEVALSFPDLPVPASAPEQVSPIRDSVPVGQTQPCSTVLALSPNTK
jgi:hypothetical protein